MNYPNDFDTPAFPAGKTVAYTRDVSVRIAVIFVLVICTCGLLTLLMRAMNNYPFLISTDPITSDWNVVAYPGNKLEFTSDYAIQENLVNHYVSYWFDIHKNNFINEYVWKKCSESDCLRPEQYYLLNANCALYCTSGETLFKRFQENIVPEYMARIELKSETTKFYPLVITPPLDDEKTQRIWKVYGILESSVNGTFDVTAFIELGREKNIVKYPATMGYYVADFNSYRTSEFGK